MNKNLTKPTQESFNSSFCKMNIIVYNRKSLIHENDEFLVASIFFPWEHFAKFISFKG